MKYRLEAQLEGADGDWTDLSEDMLRSPAIGCEYGINGTGPNDLVASTGRLSFGLNNSEANSAGLLGYYSPGHPNCRAGFALGIDFRLIYTSPITDDETTVLIGTLDSISPLSGRYGERRTLCACVDWMDRAAKARPILETQVGARADEVLQTVVDAIDIQPQGGVDFDVADSEFEFALDNTAGLVPAMTEFQRILQSEHGRLLLVGGVLIFQRRTARLAPSPVATFDGTMQSLTAPNDRASIKNRAKVTIHPRRADATPTSVLFENQSALAVAPGQTVVINARYNDPDSRAQKVGGTDIRPLVSTISTSSVANPTTITTAAPHGLVSADTVTIFGHSGSTPTINGPRVVTVTGPTTFTIPVNVTVAGTGGKVSADFRMNTAANGSGTDITGDLTVVMEPGGAAARVSITNTGIVLGYNVLLHIVGRALKDYDPIDAVEFNQDSIDVVGENPVTIDMPYQSDLSIARAVAEFIVTTWTTPGAADGSMRFVPRDDEEEDLANSIRPGTPIIVREEMTGVNGVYYIQHVSFKKDDVPVFTWTIQRALVMDYWQLGSAGFSELGVTTVLAPL